MKILGMCTAFSCGYVGVFDENGKVFAQKILQSKCKQSENFLPAIDQILTETNLSIEDIDALAVVVGPGSFTGIRIGLSIAKAFMTAFENIKAIRLNTLELLAFSAEQEHNAKLPLACINALSGNIFVSKLDGDKVVLQPQMISVSSLENVAHGDFGYCAQDDAQFFGEKCKVVDWTKFLPTLAAKKAKNNQFVCEGELLPLYLRLSQAESQLLEKEKNESNTTN